ncbi:FAD binding domain-containing protein [Microdochium trichocladiopsis]|uniref:FAD binding domain-containing protein n=1 Tax=Microdochium trichocladiopsis TaxID=1682393 RepID=A0A9P8YDW8_9PEZI|nr:FAD binding domain-containing protein [Microdochium trichocladiopsis]KAH7037082.1 FAD binding domain-containing protein [Microdochium trichocladiopsis]
MTKSLSDQAETMETVETPVLVVGSGPAGLLLAFQLARYGVRCMLVERNLDTTKWPKMDITNCRSMELFNRLGISEAFREQGVAQHYSSDVLFSTGLSEGGELVAKWSLPSPDVWKERIRQQNDGTMPREPYQRCSQAIFEAWLKKRILAEPLIDTRYGHKFESFKEGKDFVEAEITDVEKNEKYTVRSRFLVGCDGAGSRVRRNLGVELVGGPAPIAMYLVHFKSRDLSRLQKQGQFWHIFFTSGAAIIAQDEVETWTIHIPIPLDVDWKQLDPRQEVYKALGGSLAPFPIEVGEILVCSAWRPAISVAEKYSSPSLKVFLAGDSAHQNIPTGGYGMNTAVGDSFDIGWKLAAIINGWGGDQLLSSYELERKPVAIRNIERSGVHHRVHQTYVEWTMGAGPGVVTANADAGAALRERIRQHVLRNDGENQDHGIELGYRYSNSNIILKEKAQDAESDFDYRNYVPSPVPGARAPHVFLADCKTSIFDIFGPQFTLVDFSIDGTWAASFEKSASRLNIPLKCANLPRESQAKKVWGEATHS